MTYPSDTNDSSETFSKGGENTTNTGSNRMKLYKPTWRNDLVDAIKGIPTSKLFFILSFVLLGFLFYRNTNTFDFESVALLLFFILFICICYCIWVITRSCYKLFEKNCILKEKGIKYYFKKYHGKIFKLCFVIIVLLLFIYFSEHIKGGIENIIESFIDLF